MGQLAMLVFAGLVASNCVFADAEKMSDWDVQTLSGDWGGVRSDLYSKGVILEFIHRAMYWRTHPAASNAARRGWETPKQE